MAGTIEGSSHKAKALFTGFCWAHIARRQMLGNVRNESYELNRLICLFQQHNVTVCAYEPRVFCALR